MATVTTREPTRSRRARTAPVVLRGGSAARLERISLAKGEYPEKWLQDLIHEHPELLAVSEIEPAFGMLIPAAREVECGHGIIDNLFLTPSGEIVLVETKLWRNPQARREVVTQALDYVASLMCTSYEAFERQLLHAHGGKLPSLHALVADHPDALEESAFSDAVSRNLVRGRMVVLAVGDGIHREAEALVDLLQGHAGAHFTFALVEVATWRDVDTGDIVAVPDVLAQTVMIERGIVVIEDGAVRIKPMPATAVQKAQSISEEMFYEGLAARNPALPQLLKQFLASLEPLGVYARLGNSLALKVDLPDRQKPLSLGYIAKNGQYWTENVTHSAPASLGLAFLSELAEAINGQVSAGNYPAVTTNGKSGPHLDALLPEHASAWQRAIDRLISASRQTDL